MRMGEINTNTTPTFPFLLEKPRIKLGAQDPSRASVEVEG